MNLVFFVKILNFINLLTKSNAVNVALNKRTTFCEIQDLSAIVTNGNHDDRVPERIIRDCKTFYSFVDVHLINKYQIHRVLVKTEGNQFDYYFVQLLVDRTFVLCGEYPVPSVGTDVVVCRLQPPTDKVRLKSRVDNGMILYEIEVHSEGDPGKEEIFYEGCFTEFRGNQQSDADLYKCRQMCSKNYKYFGIKESKYCFCGQEYNRNIEIPAFKCNLCSKTSKFRCGGKNTFSVYKSENRKSYYAGCTQRALEYREYVIRASITSCMKRCHRNNYMLIIRGIKCACNNDAMILNGTDTLTCNIRCQNEPSLHCGGDLSYTYYKTCYYGPNSFTCDELYHCDIYTPEGYCEKCHPFYMGFGCVHRIYDKEGCWSPNVCKDQPDSTCKDVDNSYICECHENYVRLEKNGTCTPMEWTVFGIDGSYLLIASLFLLLLILLISLLIVTVFRREETQSSPAED